MLTRHKTRCYLGCCHFITIFSTQSDLNLQENLAPAVDKNSADDAVEFGNYWMSIASWGVALIMCARARMHNLIMNPEMTGGDF